jgi:CRP-like cAMP-binding protein
MCSGDPWPQGARTSVGILAETRRTATVRAVDDVELLSLDWTTFQSALEESDPTRRDFAEIVKERTAQVA